MDIRDTFFIGGFCALGYGLYLFAPWISFTICGIILMVVALAIRPAEDAPAEREADAGKSHRYTEDHAAGRGLPDDGTGVARIRSWVRGPKRQKPQNDNEK